MPGAADGYLLATAQHRYKTIFGHPFNIFQMPQVDDPGAMYAHEKCQI